MTLTPTDALGLLASGVFLWGAYGLAVGDAALVGYGLVLATSACIVLSRIRLTRRAVVEVAAAT